MRVKCINGFFIFDETKYGQIADFMRLSGFEIVRDGNIYTFADLANAPKYSLLGAPYLTATATKTYEGEPWDIFDQNGLCYDFMTGLVTELLTVTQSLSLDNAFNKFLANGLILPGSITDAGQKVKSYSGFYTNGKWYYTEVEFV